MNFWKPLELLSSLQWSAVCLITVTRALTTVRCVHPKYFGCIVGHSHSTFTISAATWGLSLLQVFFLFFWEVHVITQQIQVSGSRRGDRPHSANKGPGG